MTIYRAAQLKEELLGAIAGAQDVDLDLSAVSEIDASGVQLMLLARREAGAAGKPFRLGGRSEAVADAMRLCGLEAVFGG
jgi:anti-anti-sigma factor